MVGQWKLQKVGLVTMTTVWSQKELGCGCQRINQDGRRGTVVHRCQSMMGGASRGPIKEVTWRGHKRSDMGQMEMIPCGVVGVATLMDILVTRGQTRTLGTVVTER